MHENEGTRDIDFRADGWAVERDSGEELKDRLEERGKLSNTVESLLAEIAEKIARELSPNRELPDVVLFRERLAGELKRTLELQGIELLGVSTMTNIGMVTEKATPTSQLMR
jgi:hypothetical protein